MGNTAILSYHSLDVKIARYLKIFDLFKNNACIFEIGVLVYPS